MLNVLPVGVLIGAMLGVGALARGHELTAMRAAGMSSGAWRQPVLGCGLVLRSPAWCSANTWRRGSSSSPTNARRSPVTTTSAWRAPAARGCATAT